MLPLTRIHSYGDAAQRRVVSGLILPPPTGRKWLRIIEFGASDTEDQKARLCPDTGHGRASLCVGRSW